MTDFFVAIAVLAGLLAFGFIFGGGIERGAIGLAVIFALAMAGGTSSSDQVP